MKRVLYVLSLLADSDINWLIASGRREGVPANCPIIEENQACEHLFILLTGRFAVTVATDGAGVQQLTELAAGDIVGEISLLDSRPPSATVRAVVASEVMRIPRADLLAKLDMSPEFGRRFYRALAVMLAQRLRAASNRTRPDQQEDGTLSSEDEIDPELLEAIELGAKRFQWITERLGT